MKANKNLVWILALIGVALVAIILLLSGKNQNLATTIKQTGRFDIDVKDDYTVKNGDKLEIPIHVTGASTGTGQGIQGIAVQLKNVPAYLTNPAIEVADRVSDWKRMRSAEGKDVIFISRSRDSKDPLTKDGTAPLITMVFDVSGTVTAEEINVAFEIADNNLPSKAHEAKHTISVRAASQPKAITISGNISGDTRGGVALTCGNLPAVSSDAKGDFVFENVPDKTKCTLIPKETNFTFTPASAAIEINGASVSHNFVAQRIDNDVSNLTIFGNISGDIQAGVSLTCGNLPAVSSKEDGSYSFKNVPDGTKCTLIPKETGYTFTPAEKAISINGESVQQNFVSDGKPVSKYTLSGTISGAGKAGAALTCGSLGSVTSDAEGKYSFANVPDQTSCTLVPSKTDYSFTPESASIKIDGANMTKNFVSTYTGAVADLTISGTISGDVKAGVTISCGTLPAVTSDASGNYVFSKVPTGTTCVLIPRLEDYAFTPSSVSIEVKGTGVSQNFEADYIKGAAGAAGAAGTAGAKGDTGKTGKTGKSGSDGDDGKDGKTTVVYQSTGGGSGTSVSAPAQAPRSGMAENIILIIAAILGVTGAVIFIGARLKWFS